MMSKTVDLYYFSGTGNTLLVVRKMTEIFRQNGFNVNMLKIEKEDPLKINLQNTIGLAFPVACQSTYSFIRDFLESMPRAYGNTEVFMVDTLHSFSGAIVGPVKRLMVKKGYKTIGAKEIKMPMNLYPVKINSEKNKYKILNGLKEAEKYAVDIISGRAKWGRIPVLSDLFYSFVSMDLIRVFLAWMGQRFRVSKNKCAKCGLCVRLCPTHNITIREYPNFDRECQQCLRCVMFCPEEAITMPLWKYARYRVVAAQDLL
ncbi:MAG: EFR1 family ferrodoxin [Candidatus Omnitrophota bacterium]